MPTRDLTIAMIGSGGDGVVTMGDMMSQACAHEGLNVIKVEAYGPQIRGGESSCIVRLSAEPISAQGDFVDVIVVFNWADYGRFKGEVIPRPDAVVLYEETDPTPRETLKLGTGPEAHFLPVPFVKLATEATGTKAAKNIVTLGILAELFGVPPEPIRKAVVQKFKKKKAAVLEANVKGFEAGIAFAKGVAIDVSARRLEYEPGAPKLLMSGNEASAVGALHAGCRFFAGYPITPSSEVLHFLSEWMPRAGGSVVQTEDELSACGAIIGASFAGVKSMTSTSGPGLALMTELIGLSSMAEVPCVILDVQRGGPSTGLPTKSEQSDLWQAVYAGHGDLPRLVIAPVDVEDCFHATVDAFNLAEETQMPVIVLSEQSLGQRRETVVGSRLTHEVKDRLVPTEAQLATYERYDDTPTGISPMSSPGMKHGVYQTNGLEHDEFGRPASMHLTHEKMSAKRYRKLAFVAEKYPMVVRLGDAAPDVGILCWGSSKGPVEEALRLVDRKGLKVGAFLPRLLSPFPTKPLHEFLATVKELLILELTFSAQFHQLLRSLTALPVGHTHVFARSGGKNLTLAEVQREIEKVIARASAPVEVLA